MDRVITEHVTPSAQPTVVPMATPHTTTESARSAVSWGAIIAGAVVAAAVSLILLALAAGLGLASVSPWPSSGASLKTFSVMTAVAIIVVQWLASAVGGYITGRLRTKWTGTHTHEVFFRDTAHGFIAWALSTVVVVGLLASAAGNLAQSAGNAAASTVGTVSPYFVDTLFRSEHPDSNTPASSGDARGEATRILGRVLSTGDVPASDRAYLARSVAARTGLSESDAQKRVDDTISQVQASETKAREAADAARKASSAASLFTALSMAIGAFIASVSAALGGRLRDEHL